jgi:hypothetical protein
VFTLGVAAQLPAQEKTNKQGSPVATTGKEKKDRGVPVHGKIVEIDKTAKTIKVGESKYQVTSSTKIIKAEKPAVFDDAVVGEEVRGYYRKTDDGKLELLSLHIGPKPEKETKPGTSAEERAK